MESTRLEEWHIGWAVRRLGRKQKTHLLQSIVADAAITKCGRRMERQDSRGRRLSANDDGIFECKRCQPHG